VAALGDVACPYCGAPLELAECEPDCPTRECGECAGERAVPDLAAGPIGFDPDSRNPVYLLVDCPRCAA
jgi:hypothetical protein